MLDSSARLLDGGWRMPGTSQALSGGLCVETPKLCILKYFEGGSAEEKELQDLIKQHSEI